jgi:hypothetical protein
MSHYSIAKTYVAWWAAALSKKVPKGVVVSVISPGSNPSTSFARNMPLSDRIKMKIMMPIMGPLMGMAGPIKNGVQRYIDGDSFTANENGKFYASKPGKLVGELQQQINPHLLDPDLQNNGWKAIVTLSEGIDIN